MDILKGGDNSVKKDSQHAIPLNTGTKLHIWN